MQRKMICQMLFSTVQMRAQTGVYIYVNKERSNDQYALESRDIPCAFWSSDGTVGCLSYKNLKRISENSSGCAGSLKLMQVYSSCTSICSHHLFCPFAISSSFIFLQYTTTSLMNCCIPQHHLLYNAYKDQLDHHTLTLQRWKKIFSLPKNEETFLFTNSFPQITVYFLLQTWPF